MRCPLLLSPYALFRWRGRCRSDWQAAAKHAAGGPLSRTSVACQCVEALAAGVVDDYQGRRRICPGPTEGCVRYQPDVAALFTALLRQLLAIICVGTPAAGEIAALQALSSGHATTAATAVVWTGVGASGLFFVGPAFYAVSLVPFFQMVKGFRSNLNDLKALRSQGGSPRSSQRPPQEQLASPRAMADGTTSGNAPEQGTDEPQAGERVLAPHVKDAVSGKKYEVEVKRVYTDSNGHRKVVVTDGSESWEVLAESVEPIGKGQ